MDGQSNVQRLASRVFTQSVGNVFKVYNALIAKFDFSKNTQLIFKKNDTIKN